MSSDAISGLNLESPISSAGEFLPISGGPFFDFRAILNRFGPFRPFLGVDFTVFSFFSILKYVFPMVPNRGRTIAHRKKVLKRANWAPEVTGFFIFVQLVDLALNHWFPLVELTQQPVVSTASTHRPGEVLIVEVKYSLHFNYRRARDRMAQ